MRSAPVLFLSALMVLTAGALLLSPGGVGTHATPVPLSGALPGHPAGSLEKPALRPTAALTCCTWVTNITGFQTPQQMLYDPTDGQIWVSNGNYNGQDIFGNESVISDKTNTVEVTIPVQIGPVGIAYDSKKSEMYVVNEGGNNLANLQGSVSVISTTSDKVVSTFNNSVGINPEGALYDSDKNEIFIANSIDSTGSGPSNISIYQDSNNSDLANPVVGINPIDMAYDSAKGEIFVANSCAIADCASNNVSVISDKTNKVTNSITVGSGPYGIVYDSGKGEVFVGNYNDNNVSVINDTTDKVVATIPVGYGPISLAYDPANGFVFVANNGGNNFTTINDTSNTVISNIYTGDISPTAIVYDTAKSEVFVANAGDGTVNVLKLSNGTTSSTLTGVSVSPSSTTVQTSGTADFTATPTCSGSCSGTSYVWSQSNGALGTLSPSGGTLSFTAKTTTGTDTVFVNATLGSVTKEATATVTISTTVPSLESVAITPATDDLQLGDSASFTATPTCSSTCPAGTTYLWSEATSTLGELNATTGATVKFTANSTAGIEYLYVVATLNSVAKGGSATLTLSSTALAPLTGVALSQTSASVQVNGTTTFIASPLCSGTCPAGTVYAWSLSSTLGELNSTSGSVVQFTAGPSAGTVTLNVKAILNGVSKNSSAQITISSSCSTCGQSSSNNETLYLIIAVVVVVAVVAGVAVLMMQRRKGRARPAMPPPAQAPPPPGAPPPQYAPQPYPPQQYPPQPYPAQSPPAPPPR